MAIYSNRFSGACGLNAKVGKMPKLTNSKVGEMPTKPIRPDIAVANEHCNKHS